ncbi:MAG: hypothetical protein D4S01_02565 [Dehalococcoidia bacterium]|nr:MAG: hypothetical protein D4S01_02565 [Dehalococcoidia bacterium]
MGVETRILDAIPGDIRCQNCGRFVKIGKGKILGYWWKGHFLLFCPNCESLAQSYDWLEDSKQERV